MASLIPGSVIYAQNLSVLAVYGDDRPLCEGHRILPLINLDFSANNLYSLDFSNQMRIGRMSMVQTVFIDTSSLGPGPGPVSVQFTTGQVILANPRTQGFYPVMAQEPFRVVMESMAGGTATIIFANYVIYPTIWPSAPLGATVSGGFGNFTAHDVTSSRMTNTIYTNTTGVSMQVQFTFNAFVVSSMTAYVNGSAVATDSVDDVSAGIKVYSFLVPVPVGATYEFVYSPGGAFPAQHWIEWY